MADQVETKVLFIGGSADGKWLLVLDNMVYWKVAIPIKFKRIRDSASNSVSYDEYQRTYLYHGPTKKYSVFVATTCTKNVIELLIDGYKHR